MTVTCLTEKTIPFVIPRRSKTDEGIWSKTDEGI